MPNVITEVTTRTAAHLVSEARGNRSREVGTISGATDLPAGTVLGKVTASGNFVILAPAAADGSQNAAAILYEKAPVSAGNVRRAVHQRDCEVNGLALTWPTGITGGQQTTAINQLAALGIIVRT